jgi:hypothetical protein
MSDKTGPVAIGKVFNARGLAKVLHSNQDCNERRDPACECDAQRDLRSA